MEDKETVYFENIFRPEKKKTGVEDVARTVVSNNEILLDEFINRFYSC